MNLENEEEILAAIKRDPQKFGILFDHYYSRIFGYVHRRVNNFDVSKDIAAETFLKAYLKIGRFKWTGISLSSWFYRIATNEINLYYRKRGNLSESLDRLINDFSFEPTDNSTFEDDRERLEEEMKKYSDFEIISMLLTLLSTEYQSVISLRYFEKKSIKEICEIMGKKEGTVKSLLSRGIGKLKILYDGEQLNWKLNKQ
jgi:RNA polymerase sigma-70 factor, ECF subfamily